MQQAPVLVPGRNQENRHRLAKVRGQCRLLYRVQRPQRTQHAKKGGSAEKYRQKRGSRTWRVTCHLSDCSGGMDFFRTGGSCHGRARSSRLPHQLAAVSGLCESLRLGGDIPRPRCGEGDRPRCREVAVTNRARASARDGDGLRAVEVVESTRKRSGMSLVSGDEDKGVVRFDDTDGFKGDGIFLGEDDSEDEL